MKTIDWLTQIHGARERVGVTAEQYSDALILAFIDVESNGNPEAHRDGSQFYGLLQMGKLAGLDVGIDDTSTLDGEDGDPETEDDIEAFLRLCERYSDRHDYRPLSLAALWKGGAGTARTVSDLLEEGESFQFAIAAAELRHKIPNLVEYIRRIRVALIRWSRELKSKAPLVAVEDLLPGEAAQC